VTTHLSEGLFRTRRIFRRLGDLFRSGKKREDIFEELFELLVLADVGIPTTEKLLDGLRAQCGKDDPPEVLRDILKKDLAAMLAVNSSDFAADSGRAVVLMVGANGGGKTTTLAKLARRAAGRGSRVLMAAADTFRAAACEQLQLWGTKLGIPVVSGRRGADPASIVFDAVRTYRDDGYDLLLVDTAGRLHTNKNLMGELEKIRRVTSREIPEEPRESLLVLDAAVGRNALAQAREFLSFSGLTGVVLTKLDGTAKGGSVLAVADELGLPIKFVGLGESETDLAEFSPADYIEALFS
jgi:fused signal recognition particle receptor